MSLPRIYVPVALRLDNEVALSSEVSHYLATVLRIKLGSQFIMFNNFGEELIAKIIGINRKQVITKLVLQIIRSSPESPLSIHLGQAISRNDRMDYAIQKAVELGVNEITPLVTERCQIKFDLERMDNRLHHWQKIIIAACEQCGRNKIPLLNPVQHLSTWLSENAQIGMVCAVADEKETLFKKTPLSFNKAFDSIKLLIGPEGGLSVQEITLAVERHHYQKLTLGPRILRTETATVVAVTLLQHYWGDIG